MNLGNNAVNRVSSAISCLMYTLFGRRTCSSLSTYPCNSSPSLRLGFSPCVLGSCSCSRQGTPTIVSRLFLSHPSLSGFLLTVVVGHTPLLSNDDCTCCCLHAQVESSFTQGCEMSKWASCSFPLPQYSLRTSCLAPFADFPFSLSDGVFPSRSTCVFCNPRPDGVYRLERHSTFFCE